MEIFKYQLFDNDCMFLKSMVGRIVKVNTVEHTTYFGIVYVIDPVRKTMVLHSKQGTSNGKTVFIFLHVVETIEVLTNDVIKKYLAHNEPNNVNGDMVFERERVRRWLENMYLEPEEEGDYLKIGDILIVPPFGVDNIISNNIDALEKIRKAIGSMPAEFCKI
ncbi:uncharacterized protein LOC143201990 [Rhynchophorus ferrugineus]|uniref:uncharacterized protein LOC143201990 n=1 Tax=Rhynchophorus ferrugineus TaxID=354439 RepID=UPI003FCEE057